MQWHYWLRVAIALMTPTGVSSCCYFFALLVVSWFIPDQFYDVYAEIARVVSGIFLLLQIIIFIDFAYNWNQDWTSEEKNWKVGIIVVSLLMFICSLILVVFLFKWFGGSGCSLNLFIISFTMISTCGYTLFSVFGTDRGGVLPSATVALYCHFLCFTALSSDPSSCNTLQSGDTVHIVIGLILACLSVSYAAWNLANSSSLFGPAPEEQEDQLGSNPVESGDKNANKVEAAATTKKSDMTVAEAASGESEDRQAIVAKSTRNTKFHLIMATSAMYMAMVLTNWSSRSEAESDTTSYDLGVETMWIKIVTQWLTILLYSWTLVAPLLFPDREFS